MHLDRKTPQKNAAKLRGGGYQCDPARIQGKIVMEIRDSECEVDVDCWDEVIPAAVVASGETTTPFVAISGASISQ